MAKEKEESKIETAKSFNELYRIIKEAKETIGSEGTIHKADDIISKINELRKGLKKIQEEGKIKKLKALTREAVKELIMSSENLKALTRDITRTKGLRSTAVKLAISEVIARELDHNKQNF